MGLIDSHGPELQDAARTAYGPTDAVGHTQNLTKVIDAVCEVIERMYGFGDERHLIDLRADGWTVQHPLACRTGAGLFDCPVNQAAGEAVFNPATVGRYECERRAGRLHIGARLDVAGEGAL